VGLFLSRGTTAILRHGVQVTRPRPNFDDRYRFRAVLRFAARLFDRGATNVETLLRAANAAFFKALRFTTADVAAPTTSAPARAGISFCMLISPPDSLRRMAPP
jgi:hypothetical protein